MSYDLAVWHVPLVIDVSDAVAVYKSLCDGDTSVVTPHPSIEVFYRELTARYPEPNNVPESKIDDLNSCPWSGTIDRSDAYVIVTCVRSRANVVAEVVKELARRNGLMVFDPQASPGTNEATH